MLRWAALDEDEMSAQEEVEEATMHYDDEMQLMKFKKEYFETFRNVFLVSSESK